MGAYTYLHELRTTHGEHGEKKMNKYTVTLESNDGKAKRVSVTAEDPGCAMAAAQRPGWTPVEAAPAA